MGRWVAYEWGGLSKDHLTFVPLSKDTSRGSHSELPITSSVRRTCSSLWFGAPFLSFACLPPSPPHHTPTQTDHWAASHCVVSLFCPDQNVSLSGARLQQAFTE